MTQFRLKDDVIVPFGNSLKRIGALAGINDDEVITKRQLTETVSNLTETVSNLVKCVYTQTTSVTVSDSVIETSLMTSTHDFPANFFIEGRQLLVRLRGFHSASGNPNIRIRIKLNSTVVLDTGSVNSGNSTNSYFDIDGVINCRTVGSSGTVMGQGFYLEAGGGAGHLQMVNLSPITLNTTIAQTLDITVQWGTASASNTLTATNGYIMILNND